MSPGSVSFQRGQEHAEWMGSEGEPKKLRSFCGLIKYLNSSSAICLAMPAVQRIVANGLPDKTIAERPQSRPKLPIAGLGAFLAEFALSRSVMPFHGLHDLGPRAQERTGLFKYTPFHCFSSTSGLVAAYQVQ